MIVGKNYFCSFTLLSSLVYLLSVGHIKADDLVIGVGALNGAQKDDGAVEYIVQECVSGSLSTGSVIKVFYKTQYGTNSVALPHKAVLLLYPWTVHQTRGMSNEARLRIESKMKHCYRTPEDEFERGVFPYEGTSQLQLILKNIEKYVRTPTNLFLNVEEAKRIAINACAEKRERMDSEDLRVVSYERYPFGWEFFIILDNGPFGSEYLIRVGDDKKARR